MKPIGLMVLTVNLLLTFSFSIYANSETKLGFCAAIRGNGELVLAHELALARLIETYGPLKAAAGGSSASISMFLYQSMSKNNALTTCSTHSCQARKSLELSLLLKSVEGYVDYLKNAPEVQALLSLLSKGYAEQLQTALASWLEKSSLPIPEGFDDAQLQQLIAANFSELNTILASQSMQSLLNKQAIAFIQSAMRLTIDEQEKLVLVKYRVNEILDSIRLLGKFDAKNDNNLFIRPGIVSFESVATLIGLMGNFYAGNFAEGDAAKIGFDRQIKTFFTCSVNSQGKSWKEIKETQIEVATSESGKELKKCGVLFSSILQDYQTTLSGYNQDKKDRLTNRIQDKLSSEGIPIFVTTSLMSGNAVKQYQQTLESYYSYIPGVTGAIIPFQPSWEDIKFGYFGAKDLLNRVKSNLPQDIKSQKFVALNDASWFEAIRLSTAEPGLSQMKPLADHSADTYLSAGGWSDLHPVLVLRSLKECDKIVYITRQGGETKFGQGVAVRLGLEEWLWHTVLTADDQGGYPQNDFGIPGDDQSNWGKSYNLANPQSSFSLSIRLADAVYCTNWDAFKVTQLDDLLTNAYYQAKLYKSSNDKPAVTQLISNVYKNNDMVSSTNRPFTGSFFSDMKRISEPSNGDTFLNNSEITDADWKEFPGCIAQPLD